MDENRGLMIVLAIVSFAFVSAANKRTLVLLDNWTIRETHSIFFKTLRGKQCCQSRYFPGVDKMLGVIPRAHARYLVHPKLLFPVRVRTVHSGQNAILRARARSLTTVKLLYLVRVRMCAR